MPLSRLAGVPAAATVQAAGRRLLLGAMLITLALLLLVTGVIARSAKQAFEAEALPESQREGTRGANAILTQLRRAVALGVPADRLVGVEPFLASILDDRPTLDYIALLGPDGALAGQARRDGTAIRFAPDGTLRDDPKGNVQDVAIPVVGASPIGTLHLGVNRLRLERPTSDSARDVACVLLLALLSAGEVLVFVIGRQFCVPLQQIADLTARIAAGDWTRPARVDGLGEARRLLVQANAEVRRVNERWQRVVWLAGEVGRQAPDAAAAAQARLNELAARFRFSDGMTPPAPTPRDAAGARLPLFLCVFAEQWAAACVPPLVASLDRHGAAPPGPLVMALPIAASAALIGLAALVAGWLLQRLGARRVLLLGCLPATLGYTLSAIAGTVAAFAAARAMTGLGYALIVIAGQQSVLDGARRTRRGGGTAAFLYATMAGTVCGLAMGEVLVGRIDCRTAFAATAAMTVLVAIAGCVTMIGGTRVPTAATAVTAAAPRFARLARSLRLAARVGSVAAPVLAAAALALLGLRDMIVLLGVVALIFAALSAAMSLLTREAEA